MEEVKSAGFWANLCLLLLDPPSKNTDKEELDSSVRLSLAKLAHRLCESAEDVSATAT